MQPDFHSYSCGRQPVTTSKAKKIIGIFLAARFGSHCGCGLFAIAKREVSVVITVCCGRRGAKKKNVKENGECDPIMRPLIRTRIHDY